jgi:predicted glycosyltransferase
VRRELIPGTFAMRKARVLFYCHNTYGLGHVVRSLTLAEAVAASGAECKVITGCRHIARLHIPRFVDVHTIDPVEMDALGRPVPAADDPDKSNITARRSKQILDFCLAWRPDCIVVDHHPLGLAGELVDTLLCAQLADMRAVWGVPYPEDMPLRPYRNPRLRRSLGRYQHLLAYSDQTFDDILESWDPALMPRQVDYVGVVTNRVAGRQARGKSIVALCGGGYGSDPFHKLILAATAPFPHPVRIVAGPQSYSGTVRQLPTGRHVEFLPPVPVEDALDDAALVISRAGYNSAFHLVQTNLPVIFIPRKLQNDDQPRRAGKLAQLHNIWSIDESGTDAQTRLKSALIAGLDPNLELADRRRQIDLNGASRAAECILSSNDYSGRSEAQSS